MIKSMTGFGAGDCENEDFKAHVEIKAVNQRYLEINYHMPYTLNMFENQFSKKVKEYAARGKLDINVRFQDFREKAISLDINKGLAELYYEALGEIARDLHIPSHVTAMQIASYPDILTTVEEDVDLTGAGEVLLTALQKALKNLTIMRATEGQNILADLLARLKTLEGYVTELEALAPEIVDAYRQRLQKLLEEYLSKEDIDENRLIQEVALYTDKVNYTEETVRLRSHLEQFRDILNLAEPIGRKLDFLVQEMNREINTIASKANSATGAKITVEVKSEIEKIREQIQNLE